MMDHIKCEVGCIAHNVVRITRRMLTFQSVIRYTRHVTQPLLMHGHGGIQW